MLNLPNHFCQTEVSDIDDAIAAAVTASYCPADIARLITALADRADGLPYATLARYLTYPSSWVSVRLSPDGSAVAVGPDAPADAAGASVVALARLARSAAHAAVADDGPGRYEAVVGLLARVQAAIAAEIDDLT